MITEVSFGEKTDVLKDHKGFYGDIGDILFIWLVVIFMSMNFIKESKNMVYRLKLK